MGTTKFWSAWTRPASNREVGAAGSYDYEYERNGVSNLFMLFAPLEGWRRVEVTDRRTKADWARVVKQLVDEDYPHKDRIVLVMDNLNTHHPSSLYEEFEPAEARRIAERLEIHYTPKHGSWLDMAEIEIGVTRQCLDIPDQSALRREVGAWQQQRNRDAIRGLALHIAYQTEVPLPIPTRTTTRECPSIAYFRHSRAGGNPESAPSVIPAEAGIQNPHQQCGIRSQIYPDPDSRRNDGRFDDTAYGHRHRPVVGTILMVTGEGGRLS